MKSTEGQVKLQVLKPFTEKRITAKNAARLDTLEGKTICEISGGWKTDKTFPVIRELLQKKFPSVRFVPFTEMPPSPHGASHELVLGKIVEQIKEKRCDAVLIGNGG